MTEDYHEERSNVLTDLSRDPAMRQRPWWVVPLSLVAVTAVICSLCLLAGFLVVRNALDNRQLQTPVVSLPEPEEVEPKPEFEGIVEEEGPAFTPATIEFSFNEVGYAVTPAVRNGVYWGAVRMVRALSRDDSLTQHGLYLDYYRRLTFDPAMDDAIDEVCAQMRQVRDTVGMDQATYAEFILKYVQTIPYDFSRLETMGSDEVAEGDPRMPVQVLVDGTGDCDEKAMLACALLAHENYSIALLLFEEDQHMALGIASEREGFQNSGFEFVEVTNPTYVSELPVVTPEGGQLTSDAMVLKLESGTLAFPAFALDDIAFIIRARDTALEAAEAKRAYIESTPMTEDEYYYHLALYEACYVALNSLQMTVDEAGLPNAENPFMDRLTALAWLAQNYWWELEPV